MCAPAAPTIRSRALQGAIDQAAAARVPLALGPGVYRAGDLKLPAGAQLIGVRGSTRLMLTRGPSLISASRADALSLSGLTLDGGGMALAERRGLVHFAHARGMRITDCEIVASGRHGVMLEACEGEMTGSTVTGAEGAGVFSLDARGLRLPATPSAAPATTASWCGGRSSGDDGTLVVDNRIEDIAARTGGSGQNGNAINIFRAGNVTVRGNRINGVAFSAVRGNAASNLQILGNTCGPRGRALCRVRLRGRDDRQQRRRRRGAGRGRDQLQRRRPVGGGAGQRHPQSRTFRPAGADPNDPAGIGIGVEADTAVTGNVIENAPTAGILLGWGRYMRDVAATGNVVRACGVGIAVSVAAVAGSAVIADNLNSGARRGAIVGMNGHTAVTGELAADEVQRFAHLTISGNRVR